MPPPVAGVDGAWACSQCMNVNFATRDACNRCQLPKAQAGAAGKGGAPIPGVNGNWSCPACKNINFGTREACNRCQTARPLGMIQLSPQQLQGPSQRGKGAPPLPGINGNWLCPQCQNVNFPQRDVCNRCQAPRPPQASVGGADGAKPDGAFSVTGASGWACPLCENVNFSPGGLCSVCSLPKPDSEQKTPQMTSQLLQQQMLQQQLLLLQQQQQPLQEALQTLQKQQRIVEQQLQQMQQQQHHQQQHNQHNQPQLQQLHQLSMQQGGRSPPLPATAPHPQHAPQPASVPVPQLGTRMGVAVHGKGGVPTAASRESSMRG
mmetsp:Transcript_49164/g.137718  ORF Transcript_49164/g.137718 Transcript_49164/m.137718 type:complete len:320 (+) Transcript_49164:68-1027(+)